MRLLPVRAALLALVFAATPAFAQSWPSQPSGSTGQVWGLSYAPSQTSPLSSPFGSEPAPDEPLLD